MAEFRVYTIEPGVQYISLSLTAPYDLLDYIDNMSPKEANYVRDAHKFYFGYDQNNVVQDLSDLISLVDESDSPDSYAFTIFMQQYPPIFNQSAKELYAKVQTGWKPAGC